MHCTGAACHLPKRNSLDLSEAGRIFAFKEVRERTANVAGANANADADAARAKRRVPVANFILIKLSDERTARVTEICSDNYLLE